MPEETESSVLQVFVPLSRPLKYEFLLPQIAALANAGSGIDLITRALGISADVVRDALHLHRTGERPPKRIDPRRGRHRRKADPAWVPTYKQISTVVDRRRKAGESIDHLAGAMGFSRGTIVRAYDFANRAEALAAAREGRYPRRPAWGREIPPPHRSHQTWVTSPGSEISGHDPCGLHIGSRRAGGPRG